MDPKKTALIVGAGPAGLTAAHELLERTEIVPEVFEKSDAFGGISRTVRYRGNRMDIGGHRFFSKSDRVMDWWLSFLPLERGAEESPVITYQRKRRAIAGAGADAPDPRSEDRVMLVRRRKSRIYYDRTFFDYPVRLSPETLRKLGLARSFRILASYLRARLARRGEPENLEEFFVDRFGRELYETFFESYTEKVWGVPCREISAEWGAQRVKGLSIAKAVGHFVKQLLPGRASLRQKGTETSLIEQFLYPKYGPGQMWEVVAKEVRGRGGGIHSRQEVVGFETDGRRVAAARVLDHETGEERRVPGDWFFSSMPIPQLVRALGDVVPPQIRAIADGLVFRDFVAVGLLYSELAIRERDGGRLRDNWIYIQEPDVKLGRLQVFENWSPWLVADPENTTWLGLEYFCDEGDDLWSMTDEELVAFGAAELERIQIADTSKRLDGTVVRMLKTYPAYFGTYDRFDELRAFLDTIENLFLVGRNGMHRYNNQDHSMLTAMVAVDDILAGRTDKERVWAVNTEEEYHEEG